MTMRKIEEARARAEALKKEHDALVSELAKKKAEIDGIAAGHDKYKDNPAMLSQLEEVMKKRMEELSALIRNIDELGDKIKAVNEELNRLFDEIKTQIKRVPAKESPIVKIAKTPLAEKMLNQAMAVKPLVKQDIPVAKPAAAKPTPAVIENKKEAPAPVKEAEKKIKTEVKKTAPSGDLYDKAAREAKAQEEYLKKMSGSHKDYGAA